MKWNSGLKLRVMGGGKWRRRARAGRRAAEAACEAAGGDARRRRTRDSGGPSGMLGEGPMPYGSATTQQSIAAAEKGQAVWPGTGAGRSATRSASGRGGGGEPSGATSVRRGQKGVTWRSRRSLGETDTGGAEHTRGKRPCPNVRQQHRFQARRLATGGSQPPVSGVRHGSYDSYRHGWMVQPWSWMMEGAG
jgi:hypothetical protein